MLLALVLCFAPSAGAQKGKCQDIPVRVSIATSYVDGGQIVQSKFNGDGAIYDNGVDGVSAAIQTCNGTNDAVLNIISSKNRTAWLDLSQALTSNPPSWTATAVQIKMSVNANNLLFSGAQFTTFAGMSFSGPDRKSYQLKFVPPDTDTGTGPNQSLINVPNPTSAVTVTHYAAVGTTPETWILSPVANATATLLDTSHGLVNIGQFTVPFQMTITRK